MFLQRIKQKKMFLQRKKKKMISKNVLLFLQNKNKKNDE